VATKGIGLVDKSVYTEEKDKFLHLERYD